MTEYLWDLSWKKDYIKLQKLKPEGKNGSFDDVKIKDFCLREDIPDNT